MIAAWGYSLDFSNMSVAVQQGGEGSLSLSFNYSKGYFINREVNLSAWVVAGNTPDGELVRVIDAEFVPRDVMLNESSTLSIIVPVEASLGNYTIIVQVVPTNRSLPFISQTALRLIVQPPQANTFWLPMISLAAVAALVVVFSTWMLRRKATGRAQGCNSENFFTPLTRRLVYYGILG